MPAMTQREQDLLHRYRRFYLDLVEAGGCPGPTPSGVSLRLPRGLPPVTKHERLWVRWRRMVRDRNVRAIKRRIGPDASPGRQAATGRADAHPLKAADAGPPNHHPGGRP